ncbi:tetratricopeptide repeat protein [Pseudogracilibacillus sp. SO30301A]|uniref:tetratricopeptide repeat protein n=1 Tax=Pseudogracilibacillus sp. SO30301A TaxID=3098291 RepID=UPI00300E31E5
MSNTNNIILFPTLRNELEKAERESFELIHQQDYEQALEKLKFLLTHQISTYEIHISKLICLIKLNQLTDAEQFCENLLTDYNDSHYYDYLDYYIMILYETNKFPYIIDLINAEEKRSTIPDNFRKKFRDLYRLAYQMNSARSDELIAELHGAVKEDNHHRQWYIINKWKELNIDPPEMFLNLLKEKEIHPAIKTQIIELLIDSNFKSSVMVEKFGENHSIELKKLQKVSEHPIYLNTLQQLQNLEQENPTLYIQVKELLYQFSYIQYPKFYPTSDIIDVKNALILLGNENLSLPYGEMTNKNKVHDYVDLIKLSNELYLTICLD